jgi:hypothetical protein
MIFETKTKFKFYVPDCVNYELFAFQSMGQFLNVLLQQNSGIKRPGDESFSEAISFLFFSFQW